MYNRFMRLVVQVPAYNEESTILEVLESIPLKIKGIDEIKIIVIDDKSSDNTRKLVLEHGFDIITLNKKSGLSEVFKTGLNYALQNKADILVNIDGDNQYQPWEIEKLIEPIINKRADIAIGCRQFDKIKTCSIQKRILQRFGTFVVKLISKASVKDASSGFRAFNREAMLNINVFNSFSYTIETIIQSQIKNLTIENINISVNEQKNRKSRLFKNDLDYIFKQGKNLIRFFIIYRPCRFFIFVATIFFIIGFLIGFRYLFYFFFGNPQGHIQSLILCAIILFLSFICYTLAVVGDLFSINRRLLEDIRYEIKNKKYEK